MDKRKAIALGLIALFAGWVVYLNWPNPSDQQSADELLRREAARQRSMIREQSGIDVTAKAREDREAAFEALAAEGKGQPPPSDMLLDPDPDGFWFVGKKIGSVGVQIPFSPGQLPTPPPELPPVGENPGFVGAQACQECHQERHASFVHTAHHRTSALPSRESIHGSFEPGKNQMGTKSPDVSFKMIERDGKFYQRVAFYDWNFEVPMDLVTGSSKIGQTYLYWHGDALYQMNVSYLADADAWINSPGFVDGDAIYARQIGTRCLECHTTYADFRGPKNHFTPDSLILGISCERCHGPGKNHVQYHQKNPEDKKAQFIAQPATLSREQQLDICGQCHFGIPELIGAAYQFRPGDRLTDHYLPSDGQDDGGVHTSNQLTRLSISPCFTETEMTCSDCHDLHQNERGNSKLFSERCLKCHQTSQCGMEETLGDRLSDNCVDCHMPSRASEDLWMKTSAGKVFPPLRDHHIRVDQPATEAYLKTLEN